MKKNSRIFKLAIGFLASAAFWIALAPFLAERLIVEKTLEKADVILILAGSGAYVERTDKAAEIYRQGVAPTIILTDDGERTGWSRVEKRNIPYVEMAQRNLIARGVPAEKIQIFKPNGSGTIYEARIIKEKSVENGWKSILIVTSAYHTRRAFDAFDELLAADNVEIGIVGVSNAAEITPFYWWLTANGWTWVAGEYVKSFYYWVYY